MNIMKTFKNILTAVALVIIAAGLSSCYFRLNDDAKKQFKYDLRYRMHEAEGEVDTVTYNPGEFNSICDFIICDDVIVIQTEDEFKVEVITYNTMTDSVRVTNENGELKIGVTNQTARIFGPIQARVYTPTLTRISSAGYSNVRLSGFKSDSLFIMAVGSGNIRAFDLEISGKLTVLGTGSGDHEFNHISAGEMIIEKKGSGDGEYSDLNVGTLSVASAGSGDATLSGKAESATFHKTGSGDIDASGLKAKSVKTEESGSGNLTIDWESVK